MIRRSERPCSLQPPRSGDNRYRWSHARVNRLKSCSWLGTLVQTSVKIFGDKILAIVPESTAETLALLSHSIRSGHRHSPLRREVRSFREGSIACTALLGWGQCNNTMHSLLLKREAMYPMLMSILLLCVSQQMPNF